MKRLFLNMFALPLWASPNSSVYEMMVRSEDRSASRRASAMNPAFPQEDPLQDPPVRPVRPLPTDVPVPEPHDVPLREPNDVPVPEPGEKPKPVPASPEPKPRSTP